jgi:hypothetical protein
MYILYGKTRPTRHTLSTLGPRMAVDHTYLTWSAYSNPSWVINSVGRILMLPRKKWSCLHLSARLSGPWDPPQFLSQHSHWSSSHKPSICWRQATRLIGPISPACDRYVQYLVTGTNPSVLNRHKRGLPHRNLRIRTTLFPSFTSKCSTGPPKWPRPVSILWTINIQ